MDPMDEPTYKQLCRGVIRQGTKLMHVEGLLGELFATLCMPRNREQFPDDENHRKLWAIIDRYKARWEQDK